MYKYHALLSPPTLKPLKMDLIEGSETSANIIQTLGIHPKIETVNTEHSESLKSRKDLIFPDQMFAVGSEFAVLCVASYPQGGKSHHLKEE
jgi:hypothetical protein